jgi:hypothetical protein
MGQRLEIRGLPKALAQDAWWFATEQSGALGGGDAVAATRTLPDAGRRGLALLGLLALADALFYGHAVGLSLVVFAWAVFLTAVLMTPKPQPGAIIGPALLLTAFTLPVVDYVQTLSVGFLFAGVTLSTVWIRIGATRPTAAVARAVSRLICLVLSQVWGGGVAAVDAIRTGARVPPGITFGSWGIPVGGALILSALLIQANPILEDRLADIFDWSPDIGAILRRALFWLGMAVLVWPILSTTRARLAQGTASRRMWRWGSGLNAASVTNALVVFNLLLGAQTLLDARYLWSGGALPNGLSYATYAHRGAYPLLVTALLAGAFALAARPYLGARRGLRPLMALWLAQNVLLTGAALYRLALYVEGYGLTYLRVHAAIWMGLVAIGLILIGWQILRARSNGWLVLRTGALGVGVLYLCCFVNFAQVIAVYNLGHIPSVSQRIDKWYVCHLPATASVTISMHPEALFCAAKRPRIQGWRDWGFREWRVTRYLDSQLSAANSRTMPE